jgi:hypothetical protein
MVGWLVLRPHPLRRGELLLKEKEVKGIGVFWFFSWFGFDK